MSYTVGQILSCDPRDGHPTSKVVGVDSYDLEAEDGLTRQWKSYTLVPVDEAKRVGLYERWYVVDLPSLGRHFVRDVEGADFPPDLVIEPKLTGTGKVATIGDGDQGTGETVLKAYWDNSVTPPLMYADEVFNGDESRKLYFKMSPLAGPVSVAP